MQTARGLHGAQQMMQMITGHWVTQVVHGAARFSLADHRERGPRTAKAFADIAGLDRLATARLLRAFASLGDGGFGEVTVTPTNTPTNTPRMILSATDA
jgi:hypothetical protein